MTPCLATISAAISNITNTTSFATRLARRRLTQGRANSTTYQEGEEESEPTRISLGAIYKDAARSMSNLSYIVKPPPIPPPPKVSDPWDAVWDRAQKKYYFFHHETNETTWNQPN